MYLLDTNTIIYILKGDDQVKRNLQLRLNDPLKTSVICMMELYYGAYKSQRVSGNLAKIKHIEQMLEVIPVDTGTAEIFGRLKSDYEMQGKRLDDFDLASRLSYFLTSSPPDEQLISAARRGELGRIAEQLHVRVLSFDDCRQQQL